MNDSSLPKSLPKNAQKIKKHVIISDNVEEIVPNITRLKNIEIKSDKNINNNDTDRKKFEEAVLAHSSKQIDIKNVQKVGSHVTTSSVKEKLSNLNTQEHIKIKFEENNDTSKVNFEEVSVAHISEKIDIKTLHKSKNNNTFRLSIDEEENISSEIQIDSIICTVPNEQDVNNIDDVLIDLQLNSNKNEVDKRKENRKGVSCMCRVPKFKYTVKCLPQKLPKYHKRISPGGWFQGYGYPPKFVFFDEYQADPAGDPIDYEDGDRNDFVQKVFIIVIVMILFTFLFNLITHLTNLKYYIRTLPGLLVLGACGFTTMVVQFTYCCSNCSRIFPCNYILNVIATVCFSYISAYVSAKVAPYVILTAAGTALVISLMCLGIAFSSFDFTNFILVVAVFNVSLLIASSSCTVLVILLGVKLTILRIIVLVMSTVVTSVLIVVEIQLILGEKTVKLGDEDYTFGAYMVYTSVIGIFMKLMTVIGLCCTENH